MNAYGKIRSARLAEAIIKQKARQQSIVPPVVGIWRCKGRETRKKELTREASYSERQQLFAIFVVKNICQKTANNGTARKIVKWPSEQQKEGENALFIN